MTDRLRRALAALDDARTELVDAVDERILGDDARSYNEVDAARQFINSAIPYIQSAQSRLGGTPNE